MPGYGNGTVLIGSNFSKKKGKAPPTTTTSSGPICTSAFCPVKDRHLAHGYTSTSEDLPSLIKIIEAKLDKARGDHTTLDKFYTIYWGLCSTPILLQECIDKTCILYRECLDMKGRPHKLKVNFHARHEARIYSDKPEDVHLLPWLVRDTLAMPKMLDCHVAAVKLFFRFHGAQKGVDNRDTVTDGKFGANGAKGSNGKNTTNGAKNKNDSKGQNVSNGHNVTNSKSASYAETVANGKSVTEVENVTTGKIANGKTVANGKRVENVTTAKNVANGKTVANGKNVANANVTNGIPGKNVTITIGTNGDIVRNRNVATKEKDANNKNNVPTGKKRH